MSLRRGSECLALRPISLAPELASWRLFSAIAFALIILDFNSSCQHSEITSRTLHICRYSEKDINKELHTSISTVPPTTNQSERVERGKGCCRPAVSTPADEYHNDNNALSAATTYIQLPGCRSAFNDISCRQGGAHLVPGR
jgi:hypothetical protein